MYGCGGHKKPAGCQVDIEILTKILKLKMNELTLEEKIKLNTLLKRFKIVESSLDKILAEQETQLKLFHENMKELDQCKEEEFFFLQDLKKKYGKEFTPIELLQFIE